MITRSILILMLTVLLLACGKPEATVILPDQPDATVTLVVETDLRPLQFGREIQSRDGRFSIMVPSEWVQVQDMIAELSFQTMSQTAGVSLNVVRETVTPGTVVDGYTRDARTRVETTYADVQTRSFAPVTVGGREAMRWVYTANVSGQERQFYQLYLVVGVEGFVITGLAPASVNFDDAVRTFDSVSGSLTFARG